MKIFFAVPLFILTFALCGCSSYQKKIEGALNYLQSGEPNKAVEELKPLAEKDSDDQLVYLLEYGVALQAAGRYDESNKAFSKAEDIADIKDYYSLSRITGSILLNEGMVQYKGDDYEKILINAYKAINYAVLGKLEEAQVECRRLNNKLYKYKMEAKKDYEQNSFAKYLSAIIWEADHNWDSAYIDYKATYQLEPDYAPLADDLLLLGQKADREQDLEKWKKTFSKVKPDPARLSRDYGELIVIYQQGLGPQKYPHPDFPRVPKLYPRRSNGTYARIEIGKEKDVNTHSVYSVEDVAIKTLDDAYAGLIAKRAAGIAAKYVVADQVAKKNEALGFITWIALNASDQADLRQWASLPASFQIGRKALKPGKYKIRVAAMTGGDAVTGEASEEVEIQIKPGQKTFYTWRSYK